MLFKRSYEFLAKWSTLLVRIGIFALMVVGTIWLVRYCRSSANDGEWELSDTGLKIESIKEVTELCTVSFRDEVIVDTLERYTSMQDQLSGSLEKLGDPDTWRYSTSLEKRRLTLIVGGELRFGFDLKNGIFKLENKGDTTFITVSKPKELDVIVLPSKTSVFKEHGTWQDDARRKLQQKAIKQISAYSKKLNLEERSKKQFELLISKLIGPEKAYVISYI